MTDERDDLLKEIGAAVSIEPSPELAAKVRREIDHLRPAPFLSLQVFMGAAVVVACLAITVVIVREGVSPASTTSVRTSAPAVEERHTRSVSEKTPTTMAARRTVTEAGEQHTRASMIVAADEVDAFWRLVAAVQTDELTVPPARWAISEITGEIEPLPEIAAIDVPAVTIELLPGTESEDKVGGSDD